MATEVKKERAAIEELTQAVRASEQFQNAEAAGRLIKIPVGDGMALVFYKSPEEPVKCAIEISRALKDLGLIYLHAHRYDDAIAQLRKTIELDPHFYLAPYYLRLAFQLKGQFSQAIGAYQKAVELNDDPENLAYLGQAYARAGRRDEAQKILARLTEEAKSRYVSAYSFAVLSFRRLRT